MLLYKLTDTVLWEVLWDHLQYGIVIMGFASGNFFKKIREVHIYRHLSTCKLQAADVSCCNGTSSWFLLLRGNRKKRIEVQQLSFCYAWHRLDILIKIASSATNISECSDLAHSGTTVLDDFQTHTGNENDLLSTSSSTQCQRLEMRHYKNSLPLSRTWMSTTETDYSS